MSTRKAKVSFAVKRFANFLKIFTRIRRGMLGLGILFFFITVAIIAPLLTTYSPVRIPTHPAYPPIAAFYAKPQWFSSLPPPVGGKESQNVKPIKNPSFSTAASLQAEGLEFTSTSLPGQSVSQPQFASDKGYNENGCIKIVFERGTEESPEEVTAKLTKEFHYSYTVPPRRFVGLAAVLVETSEDLPVRIGVFIEKEGGEPSLKWWNQTFSTNETTWATPNPHIDSYASKAWLQTTFGSEWGYDPARTMFSEPADYTYGVEITFNDTKTDTGVEATVYIDDFYIQLFGTSFGLLGSDQYGRDIFTQLLYGARVSLIVGLLSAFFSTSVGLIVGLVAGYMGKLVDQILMRFTDMLLVIPDTPLYIVLMAVISPTVWNLILLITVIGWTGFARVVRSQVLSLRERPFVEAAKAVGAGKFRIILRHILPNVMSLVYVTLATAVPYAIVSEAWLSWLGLYDPTMMTWGRMLHDAENTVEGIRMWWWIVPPGICIALISLSFILLGYALDEILNPKLRERY